MTPRTLPSIPTVLADPCISYALKRTLREYLERDPVDALKDAELLTDLLADRLMVIQPLTAQDAGGAS